MAVYHQSYDSIEKMVKENETKPFNSHSFNPYSPSSQDKGKSSFTGTESYDEAVNLLTHGWSDGSAKLTKKLNIANSKIQSKDVKKAIYDIVGFQASVPRYLQGIPTNMVNKKNFKKKTKIVNIYKSISYNASFSTDAIMNDSVKFLQIVQAIEKKGIRCNVFTLFHSERGLEELIIKTKIKSSRDKLNISKMSFPLLHPSFLRRIIFRAMEKESRLKAKWYPGYGSPCETSATMEHVEDGDIYIPIMLSENKAIELVEKFNK